MFFFTYLPQAAVLAIFNGPLAAVSAALLVMSESSTIFNVMARALLVEDSLIDTFDGVSILEFSHISGSHTDDHALTDASFQGRNISCFK